MNYLLTGAEFNNKGAEAMTLVALKNIYENDTNANVFLIDSNFFPSFELKKKITFLPLPLWNLRILSGRWPVRCYRARIKDFIKFFVPSKKSFFGTLKKTKKVLEKIDVVIDISGFAFSSKWGDLAAMDWLSRIDMMKKIGAKIWIMPQSFGPFDFASDKVIDYAKEVLKKCECIYAREESGYKLLKNLGLSNIKKMSDTVLIEKKFNPSFLINDFNKYSENLDVSADHNVALIPNFRLIDKGGIDCDKLICFYTDVINKYNSKYNFYLVAHAGEDLAICKKIKDHFTDSDKVILIDHVLSSFNYQNFTKKLDFIIASRYHSIIHAYKESVPAVVLGWADKYSSVLSETGQMEYLIDLDNYNKALSTVDKMSKSYKIESRIIKENVEKLQEKSCYDFLKTLNFENR
ncbi:MAG: polysaccharide pyruvyl transferase family protein [Treponema sp.]|nr:polysaccharide pyruvyl transferase family protein [Treponema sp.]